MHNIFTFTSIKVNTNLLRTGYEILGIHRFEVEIREVSCLSDVVLPETQVADRLGAGHHNKGNEDEIGIHGSLKGLFVYSREIKGELGAVDARERVSSKPQN
jgi:hypothetical protein